MADSEPTKKCSVCGVVEPLTEYHRHPRSKDGTTGYCNVCAATKKRKYRARAKLIGSRAQADISKAIKQRIASGEKTCIKCGKTKPFSDFNRHVSAADGHDSRCRSCQSNVTKAHRAQLSASEKESRREAYNAWQRRAWKTNKEFRAKQRARNLISDMVRRNKIPAAADLACSQCGSPAHQYHHYLGYEPPHDTNVIPVCKPCHELLG
jgi:hypothetical protein